MLRSKRDKDDPHQRVLLVTSPLEIKDFSIVTKNGSKGRQGFNKDSICNFQTTVFVVDILLNQIKGKREIRKIVNLTLSTTVT